MIEPDPSTLAAFLADRDVPCPGCGYNLRGLPSDRCPECHAALSVDRLTPIRRPFSGYSGWTLGGMALIGSAIAAHWVYAFVYANTHGGSNPLAGVVWIAAVFATLIFGAALAVVASSCTRHRMRSGYARGNLALVTSCGLAAGALAWLAASAI
jgi:hypothetical protein